VVEILVALTGRPGCARSDCHGAWKFGDRNLL